MKYVKSCSPKETLLDTTISLIAISFIEITYQNIGFYIDEIRILQFQCHQIL